MEALERIRSAIETKLAGMGMELYDLKYNRAGRHSSLRVFIDKAGGVTIDDCEKASHEISMVLDVEEFSDSPYSLEVSSPGADRPMKTERDFKRALGRAVRIVYLDDDGKSRTLTGTLTGCEGAAAQVEAESGVLSIRLADILSSKIELQF